MKTRILVLVAISAIGLSGCATSGSRYPAGGPQHGGGGGGGRPEAPPVRGNQGPPRTQGTVIAQHPSTFPGGPNRPAPDHPIGPSNPPHQVVIHDPNSGRDENHPVIVDHRPPSVQSHDPHVRVMVRRDNFHPVNDWGRFHPPIRVGYVPFRPGYDGEWFGVWGVNDWSTVGTVTCEATDETTGELFPVTMERDGNGWDDPSINNILDEALDDCAAETGSTSICIAATPACTFDQWDGHTVYRTN